jgi:hypothetical protein
MPHKLLEALELHLASPKTFLNNGNDWGLGSGCYGNSNGGNGYSYGSSGSNGESVAAMRRSHGGTILR